MTKVINPANESTPDRDESTRIPMSLPQQKLSAPDIPGYHTHWMLGTPERIAQAKAAWYEFVDESETKLNDVSVGGDPSGNGNTDLGSRVSRGAGADIGADGQPVRLYLMKLRQDLWEKDQAALASRNAKIAEQLTVNFRAGTIPGPGGQQPSDMSNRYVDMTRTKVPDFFKPKST